MLNCIVRAREVVAIWYVGFNLTFEVHKKAWYFYSPKSLFRHGVNIYNNSKQEVVT